MNMVTLSGRDETIECLRDLIKSGKDFCVRATGNTPASIGFIRGSGGWYDIQVDGRIHISVPSLTVSRTQYGDEYCTIGPFAVNVIIAIPVCRTGSINLPDYSEVWEVQ